MPNAFVSPADLLAEYGHQEMVDLTDRSDPRTGEVDTGVAQRACDRAAAEVQAALAGRYALPLAQVPDLLRWLARDLAHYHLHLSEPADVTKDRAKEARRQLAAIQRGEMALGLDVSGAPVQDRPQDLPEFDVGRSDFGGRY